MAVAGCSAIVSPDTRRLQPGEQDARVLVIDAAVIGTDTGPSPMGRISPSNVEPALLDEGRRELVVEVAASFDTERCSASSVDSRIVRQRDRSEVCALIVSNLHIASEGTLRVFGPRPLVVLASGDMEIEGTLDVSARGTEPGAGGGVGGTPRAPDGGGLVRGRGGSSMGVYSDGGGGGGGLCSTGGNGGAGGPAMGGGRGEGLVITLEPLVGGGGGGLGPGGGRTVPDGNAGLGGAGGGAVQLTARGTLRLRGRIHAGGGGGGGGAPDDRFTNWGAGGGGGGGGGILLEATTLRIEPGAFILASGGGGGAGANAGAPPSPGRDGREAVTRASGGVGGGMYGASGGGGGAGAEGAGLDGASNTAEGSNGGGGGGGAGCIVLRAPGGAARPDSVTLSPATTGFVTLPAHTR
jgi:hypothetical protein